MIVWIGNGAGIWTVKFYCLILFSALILSWIVGTLVISLDLVVEEPLFILKLLIGLGGVRSFYAAAIIDECLVVPSGLLILLIPILKPFGFLVKNDCKGMNFSSGLLSAMGSVSPLGTLLHLFLKDLFKSSVSLSSALPRPSPPMLRLPSSMKLKWHSTFREGEGDSSFRSQRSKSAYTPYEACWAWITWCDEFINSVFSSSFSKMLGLNFATWLWRKIVKFFLLTGGDIILVIG